MKLYQNYRLKVNTDKNAELVTGSDTKDSEIQMNKKIEHARNINILDLSS